MYCSWASSTWALPSRLRACWAKMSRISAVRSMTLTCTTPSRRRSWLGVSSPSQITGRADRRDDVRQLAGLARAHVGGRVDPAAPLDEAVKHLGARRFRRRLSSRSEFSALARLPSAQTPISTTRSSRSARYSTWLCPAARWRGRPPAGAACRSSRSMLPGWVCGSGCSSKTVLIILRHFVSLFPRWCHASRGTALSGPLAAPYVPAAVRSGQAVPDPSGSWTGNPAPGAMRRKGPTRHEWRLVRLRMRRRAGARRWRGGSPQATASRRADGEHPRRARWG